MNPASLHWLPSNLTRIAGCLLVKREPGSAKVTAAVHAAS